MAAPAFAKAIEVRAGPFRLKAEHAVNPKFLEDALHEVREGAAKIEQPVDTRRLVIRGAQGRPRILASTLDSLGSGFPRGLDEYGEERASLSASSATDPSGVALLLFPGKCRPPGDMASMIGAEMDGSGAVGVRRLLWRLEGNVVAMRLQHAAALALVSWYLMVPPAVCRGAIVSTAET